jgi:pyruvate/2-oxoglutarate dehydrogenase complex dihydrolipoamide dehydrogenase (E3) component
MAIEFFDDIIVGGGKAGKTLAPALVSAGRKVALVERTPLMVGGSCINVACIPTKTLLASAEVVHTARIAPEYGIHTGRVTVDPKLAMKRKRTVVESMRALNQRNLDNTLGENLVFGSAAFISSREIEVRTPDGVVRTLQAERIFINTGTRPKVPAIEGLDGVGYLTSETILELEVVPQHLVILGAGYVALEFAHLYRQWGSLVTVVTRGSQVLPRQDADIARAVEGQLRSTGIEFRFGATNLRASGRDPISLIFSDSSGPGSVSGSHLLVATGRQANTEELNVTRAGLSLSASGFLTVNERLETQVPGIWALGDVNGGPQFTHASLDDFRVIKSNLIDRGSRTTRRLMPSCLFIDPELAQVGLTEAEARAAGHPVRVVTLEAGQIPRAKTVGKTTGVLKAIVGADDRILGCTFFCHAAGEMISTVQTAMIANLPFTWLRDAVLVHPTMTEGLNLLFARV